MDSHIYNFGYSSRNFWFWRNCRRSRQYCKNLILYILSSIYYFINKRKIESLDFIVKSKKAKLTYIGLISLFFCFRFHVSGFKFQVVSVWCKTSLLYMLWEGQCRKLKSEQKAIKENQNVFAAVLEKQLAVQ